MGDTQQTITSESKVSLESKKHCYHMPRTTANFCLFAWWAFCWFISPSSSELNPLVLYGGIPSIQITPTMEHWGWEWKKMRRTIHRGDNDKICDKDLSNKAALLWLHHRRPRRNLTNQQIIIYGDMKCPPSLWKHLVGRREKKRTEAGVGWVANGSGIERSVLTGGRWLHLQA